MDKKSTQTTISSTAYNPTPFDKAFVRIIETIVHSSVFKGQARYTRKELMKKMKLAETSYQNIKKGSRGVPANKVDDLTTMLIKDFGVLPRFLKTFSGPMFKDNHENGILNNILNDGAEVYLTAQHKLELLQKEIEHLNQIIKEKDKLITTLNKALEITRGK